MKVGFGSSIHHNKCISIQRSCNRDTPEIVLGKIMKMLILWMMMQIIITMPMVVVMIRTSKHSVSIITCPILREVGGKQQNWFYGTNSSSLPSMTLLDVFHLRGDDDNN